MGGHSSKMCAILLLKNPVFLPIQGLTDAICGGSNFASACYLGGTQ
jgi:hypothetical protein